MIYARNLQKGPADYVTCTGTLLYKYLTDATSNYCWHGIYVYKVNAGDTISANVANTNAMFAFSERKHFDRIINGTDGTKTITTDKTKEYIVGIAGSYTSTGTATTLNAMNFNPNFHGDGSACPCYMIDAYNAYYNTKLAYENTENCASSFSAVISNTSLYLFGYLY